MEQQNYKRTVAGSVGAGIASVFNASGRKYYILEHKTASQYHPLGENQKVIVDQIELGRDSSCQVRFDESFETVSRRHAAIVRDGEKWKLIPLSQTNATIVNGQAINQETELHSGDEIRLSTHGPVLGFIIPQGSQSLVKSIGLTERMNLFRKQALRPYKTALWILAIALVLAVGGLTAYNIHMNKVHEAEMAAATEKIEAAQVAVNELSAKADSAEAELAAATSELETLKSDAQASQEQLDAANARIAAAQSAAYSARRAANDAIKKYEEAQNEYSEIAKDSKSTAPAATDKSGSASLEKAFVDSIIGDEENQPASEQAKKFAEISDCYNAVYFIRMDDIAIYDKNNKEVVKFNGSNVYGGTGFLLSDGRFITASRVVEPWFYYNRDDSYIGSFNGYNWTFRDVQICANAGLRVIANFTAYSPSGSSFKFSNTEMTQKNIEKIEKKYYNTEVYRIANANRQIRRIVEFYEVTLYWHNSHPYTDWATMAKRDQLNVVSGLEFDNSFSMAPKAGVEVSILGFPHEEGFTDSHNITPRDLRNNINVERLNDENVIELSSRRWMIGNDGAPVLMNKDGQWVVVGILSHTDSSDRDLVVPIAATK